MRFNKTLWVFQALMAALFLFAGSVKLVLPLDQLTGPVALPGLFLRFIGAAEVFGAMGLVLPGALRIHTELTPLAAAGLVVIMIGATVITAMSGSVVGALFPFVVGVCLASISYGRWPVATGRPVQVLASAGVR